MKKQVIVIHGGDSFETKEAFHTFLEQEAFDPREERAPDWKYTLRETLGENYEVFRPSMPAKQNADYIAWCIWFEKLFPYVTDEVILVGHSLGGSFLAKYLSEHTFPKSIQKLYLVAPAFADEEELDGGVGNFAQDSKKLPHIETQVDAITIYHSTDDPVVPYTQAQELQKYLPKAELILFEDRHHFIQEEFPEIVEDIKGL